MHLRNLSGTPQWRDSFTAVFGEEAQAVTDDPRGPLQHAINKTEHLVNPCQRVRVITKKHTLAIPASFQSLQELYPL